MPKLYITGPLLGTLPCLLTFLSPGSAVAVSSGDFHILARSRTAALDQVLPDLGAVTIFDPFHRRDMSLRLTDSEYDNLPVFHIRNGQLEVVVLDQYWCPESCIYTLVEPAQERSIALSRSASSNRETTIDNDSLLSVDGEMEWTLCGGALGALVVSTWTHLYT